MSVAITITKRCFAFFPSANICLGRSDKRRTSGACGMIAAAQSHWRLACSGARARASSRSRRRTRRAGTDAFFLNGSVLRGAARPTGE